VKSKQLKRSACENEKVTKKYTNPAKLSVENSKKIIKMMCYGRIFVYNICLISLSETVSDGATNKSVQHKEFVPEVLHTFCARRV